MNFDKIAKVIFKAQKNKEDNFILNIDLSKPVLYFRL